MKYSFMTFSCPELSLQEALDLAKRHGYDGLEPRTDGKQKHGVEVSADKAQRAEIRKMAEASGIALCCVAASIKYSDPLETASRVEQTRAYIDLASDVGSPCLRVFGGPIPSGMPRAQSADAIVEALKHISDHAWKKQVTVCVETHDDWCDPEDLADVLRRVNHPAVACNWDIMHPVRVANTSMVAAGTILRNYIKHVHIHDCVNNGIYIGFTHIGEGVIDHKAAVEVLQSLNYDGYLSSEWIKWKPCEEYLARDLTTMKSYEAPKPKDANAPVMGQDLGTSKVQA